MSTPHRNRTSPRFPPHHPRPSRRFSELVSRGAHALSVAFHRVSTVFTHDDDDDGDVGSDGSVPSSSESQSSITSTNVSDTEVRETRLSEATHDTAMLSSVAPQRNVAVSQSPLDGATIEQSIDTTSQDDVPGRIPDQFLPLPGSTTNALGAPRPSIQPQRPEGSIGVARHRPSGATQTVALFDLPMQDQTGIQMIRRLEDNPAYRPISGPSTRPDDAAASSSTPRRRAILQREGAFHERDRPYWNSGSGHEPPEVRGRAAAAMPENQMWEDDWGPVPHLTDVTEHSNGPPTPQQVIEYLNGRYRLNRRAYYLALDILFPQPRDEEGENVTTTRRPVFRQIVPTASWRRTANWEGGIVPVDREWGPSHADDAADADAECDSSDEGEAAEGDLAVSRAELRAIRDHVRACLAASPTSASVTATSATMSGSSSPVLPAGTPSSPGSSTSRKRSREDSCEADGEQSSSDSSSSEGRPSVRRRFASHNGAPMPRTRAERREAARERLRAKLRKSRDRLPPVVPPEVASDTEAAGLSLPRRVAPSQDSSSSRRVATNPSALPLESDGSPEIRPRSLKRSRGEVEAEETSCQQPEDDDRKRKEERKKKSKKE